MAIHDLYSKRLRRQRGEEPDVYSYDSIPRELKTQIFHIFDDGILTTKSIPSQDVYDVWDRIVSTLNREYGSFTLAGFDHTRNSDYYDEFIHFIFNETRVERILDGIELALGEMNTTARKPFYAGRYEQNAMISNLIDEANSRFKEHGLGYRFAENILVRIDSEFLHAQVTKPALLLLQQDWCAGAEEEFFRAHEHYRNGRYKETLNECLKSFESMMKSICYKNSWPVNERATASNLIQTCMDNGLVDPFWQSQFSALKSLLESGIPTGRNRLSGHGQGAIPTEIPAHIVSYMMNMTAACLLFLGESDSKLI